MELCGVGEKHQRYKQVKTNSGILSLWPTDLTIYIFFSNEQIYQPLKVYLRVRPFSKAELESNESQVSCCP